MMANLPYLSVRPQATEVDVVIRDEDIRIDTYRSSGAGGQHVNTTNSAVRAPPVLSCPRLRGVPVGTQVTTACGLPTLPPQVRVTHVPTGTVVAIQDERSQHKNKAKALKARTAPCVACVSMTRHSGFNDRVCAGPRWLLIFCAGPQVLRARIFERQMAQQREQRAEMVKGLIGSADRSERIRTYNFQQARCPRIIYFPFSLSWWWQSLATGEGFVGGNGG